VPEPAFVAAVDFGGTKVAVATATLDGGIIDQLRLETQAARGAAQAVDRALDSTRSIIARTGGETGGRCVAAGVVCPGIVLPDRIALAPNVPGWEQLALAPLVRGALGIECVAVCNDVKAAGLAELRWGALSGADPALFLSLGTGVAAAVLVGGHVLLGAHSAAGEIGYNLRYGDDAGAFADGRAPLEELAGGRFIGVRSSRLAGSEMTCASAFAARDARTRELVDDTLDELAVHVANMAILLDPERIAVGGGMMASGQRVLAALERRLQRALPFPPDLVCARFVHDAALRGAVALALDAVPEGRPARADTTLAGARPSAPPPTPPGRRGARRLVPPTSIATTRSMSVRTSVEHHRSAQMRRMVGVEPTGLRQGHRHPLRPHQLGQRVANR
jgi:glucokinase